MEKCAYCNKEFADKFRRARHYHGCAGYKLYKKTRDEIIKETAKIECTFCGKKFINNKSLQGHNQQCSIRKEQRKISIKKWIKYILEQYEFRSAYDIGNELRKCTKEDWWGAGLIIKLVSENLIKTRSISESMQLQTTKDKRIQTCLEQYGDVNVLGRNSPIYDKRNNTVIERYGVKNVFQDEEVKSRIFGDELYLERYDKTRSELISENTKRVWKSYTPEERKNRGRAAAKAAAENYQKRTGECYCDFQSRKQLLYWSNASEEDRKKRGQKSLESKIKNGTQVPVGRSSLEILIEEILIHLDIPFISQFHIYGQNGQNYFFDFKIGKTLIEINGDYWHANPLIYNNSDLISYPGGKKIFAEDIWNKDYEKQKNTHYRNYNYLYIWEFDIKNNLEEIVNIMESLNGNQIY